MPVLPMPGKAVMPGVPILGTTVQSGGDEQPIEMPTFVPNIVFGGQPSKSMDRQEKRRLMTEIKEEMKTLITQISEYQVE